MHFEPEVATHIAQGSISNEEMKSIVARKLVDRIKQKRKPAAEQLVNISEMSEEIPHSELKQNNRYGR